MRPALVWGCSKYPMAVRAAISFRMVAEEYFISGREVIALEPTGSAVLIYRSTTLRRTFFFRSVSSMRYSFLFLALNLSEC